MRFTVPVATFAVLAVGLLYSANSSFALPACAAVAQPPAQSPSQPLPQYAVFIYVNGYLEEVTADAAYVEDHLFVLGSYVGDRTGPNGEIIMNNGFIVGYLEPL